MRPSGCFRFYPPIWFVDLAILWAHPLRYKACAGPGGKRLIMGHQFQLSSNSLHSVTATPSGDSQKMRFVIVDVAASLMAGSALASIAVDSMDDKIRAYCAMGACAGSLAYFLKNKIYQQPDYAAVLFWNFLAGICLTPFLCQIILPLIGIAINFNSCVALSMLIAWSMPWILDFLCPELGKKIQTFVRKLSIKDLLMKAYDLSEKDKRK